MKDKITVKRIIQNNIYILKYAWKLNKSLLIIVFSGFIFCTLTWAFSSSLFLKLVVNCLTNPSISVEESVRTIVIGSLIVFLGYVGEYSIEPLTKAKFTYMAGQIQKDMYERAASMDLVCYDNTDYYDDFVIAAKQSEEMIIRGVIIMAGLSGAFAMMIFLGVFILTVNPIIIIFPAIGFVINTICVSKMLAVSYQYEMEQKRIMRKADYSKRVFYQPEYAKEIKLSHIEIPLRRQFDDAIEEVIQEAKKKGRTIAILNVITWVSVYTLLSYCFPPIFLGYLALVKRTIALDDVASLSSAQESFRNSLNGINYQIVEFQRVGQYAERFRKFMEYEIHTEGQPGKEVDLSESKVLEIRDMSFRYEGAKKDTLHHINMTVKPGQKIAIVGENGAGKTTFVKLLMRLYDVTGGSIQYNGVDIREYATDSYRKVFGSVFQDFQLYAAKLGENIMMEQYDEKDKEKLIKALETADFKEKFERLEHGLDTELTREFFDEGTMLSGGESQKVAISRLFARENNIGIAILDEPSSALDPKAEYILNKNMMEKSGDATVIFISHRLSTTRTADCIYMFEHGKIVEQGTHDQLMELNGRYAEMFEKQAHYYQDTM